MLAGDSWAGTVWWLIPLGAAEQGTLAGNREPQLWNLLPVTGQGGA